MKMSQEEDISSEHKVLSPIPVQVVHLTKISNFNRWVYIKNISKFQHLLFRKKENYIS